MEKSKILKFKNYCLYNNLTFIPIISDDHAEARSHLSCLKKLLSNVYNTCP